MKDTGGRPETGMTLRDDFAAKAMQGLLSAHNPMITDTNGIAEAAYEMADAMLAERSKT
jgi:hypothetical protein